MDARCIMMMIPKAPFFSDRGSLETPRGVGAAPLPRDCGDSTLDDSMAAHKLILTSNGLTSSGLQAAYRDMAPEQAVVWYIPTAPLRDGWSRAQVERQADNITRMLNIAELKAASKPPFPVLSLTRLAVA